MNIDLLSICGVGGCAAEEKIAAFVNEIENIKTQLETGEINNSVLDQSENRVHAAIHNVVEKYPNEVSTKEWSEYSKKRRILYSYCQNLLHKIYSLRTYDKNAPAFNPREGDV